MFVALDVYYNVNPKQIQQTLKYIDIMFLDAFQDGDEEKMRIFVGNTPPLPQAIYKGK